MNNWIPLSWGCTGNALSSQWSIKSRDYYLTPLQITQRKKGTKTVPLGHHYLLKLRYMQWSQIIIPALHRWRGNLKPQAIKSYICPDLTQSGMSMIIQYFFLRLCCNCLSPNDFSLQLQQQILLLFDGTYFWPADAALQSWTRWWIHFRSAPSDLL